MFIRYWGMAACAMAMLPALASAAPLTLDQAIDLALARSEATRSARAGLASASEAARAAGQLPDPTLRAGVDNLPVTRADRFSTARDAMTMKRIGVSQEWVSTEKRALRQAAADALTGREAVAAEAAAAEVRLQTALAYIEAYFAGEMLELATASAHHLHEELAAATARLASPAGSSQEVLAVSSAQGMADDDAAELLQQRSAARVSLERWTGAPANELAAPAPKGTASEVAFIAKHPMVLAARREAELARREAAVVASNRRPNWSWEVSYGQRSGYSDMVSFGVSIPWQVSSAQRQDRETASKLALVDKAEGALAEAERAALAEYRSLSSDTQRLADRIERYQSSVVLPARQRSLVAMASYRANQLTLAVLFEARHSEVEAQRKLVALKRELAKSLAQLAYKPLDLQGAP